MGFWGTRHIHRQQKRKLVSIYLTVDIPMVYELFCTFCILCTVLSKYL